VKLSPPRNSPRYDRIVPSVAEDCAFCEGRSAAEAGEPLTANPYPVPEFPAGSREYEDSDWSLWEIGHSIGSIDWSTVKPVRRGDTAAHTESEEGET
jgi:hypothetical protein